MSTHFQPPHSTINDGLKNTYALGGRGSETLLALNFFKVNRKHGNNTDCLFSQQAYIILTSRQFEYHNLTVYEDT